MKHPGGFSVYASLFTSYPVFDLPFLVKVSAVYVVDHPNRKVFHLKAEDRFGGKVFIGDYFRFFNVM
jgi:hypothetical protein